MIAEDDQPGEKCATEGCHQEGEYRLHYDGPLYCRECCEEIKAADIDNRPHDSHTPI